MNERIRELAEQANYLATEKEFPYDTDWFYLYNKKFAELIVRECIGQVETTYAGSIHSYASPWNSAVAKSVTKIKEHFGVE